jgi:hypothetical protein
MLSRPVRLRWAGWESNTLRLQQAGWQLSAAQDVCRQRMRLALRHPQQGCEGISSMAEWHYMRDHSYLDHLLLPAALRFGPTVYVTEMPSPDVTWSAIDAQPQLRPEAKRLGDFVHFAPVPKPIIVPADTVPDLMERILKLQQPARETHFKNLVTIGSI